MDSVHSALAQIDLQKCLRRMHASEQLLKYIRFTMLHQQCEIFS